MAPSNPTETSLLDYDRQARNHYWHPEALFGLAYEYLRPGDRLLDAGIGTGLASETFARAGLQVFGFDADPTMVAACRAKGFAVDLREHDLQHVPWPYASQSFDHLLLSGVLHFLPTPATVFHEVRRLLRPGGIFVFTIKAPPTGIAASLAPEQVLEETIQGTTLYLHPRATIDRLMAEIGVELRKELRLMIKTGRDTDDLFCAFVTQRTGAG